MECLSLLLLAGLAVAGLAALRDLRAKLRHQGEQLDDLRGELGHLHRRLRGLEAGRDAGTPPAERPPRGTAEEAAVPAAGMEVESRVGPRVESEAEQPAAETGDTRERQAPAPLSPPRTVAAEPPAAAARESIEDPEEEEEARPALDIDWEQWLGMRGAAVVGGIALAIAAFLFLRYSIEEGWFPPVVRVALAFLTGAACLGSSEVLRRRDYATTANSVAGAGVVILYAATWAARELYGFLPLSLALALMVLTTVVCGLLAWRHDSPVVALLGLVGGFATPLLLDTGPDHPLGLFGYILLLDAGLLSLARRKGWPTLASLAVLGTLGYQALWILNRMEAADLTLALVILGAFAALFLLAAGGRRRSEAGAGTDGPASEPFPHWGVTRYAGALLPLVFGLYLAGRADLTPHLGSLVSLMALICVAAAWLARWRREPLLAVWVALGSLGVVTVWAAVHAIDLRRAWELCGAAVALSAAFHLPRLLEPLLRRLLPGAREARGGAPPPFLARGGPAAAVAAGGFSVLLSLLGPFDFPAAAFLPWSLALVLLAALLLWQGRAAVWGWLGPATAVLLGAAPVLFHLLHPPTPAAGTTAGAAAGTTGGLSALPRPDLVLTWGLSVVLALAFHGLALARRSRRREGAVRLDDLASVLLPAAALVFLLPRSLPYVFGSPRPVLGGLVLVLALLAVLGATRLPSGLAYLGILLLTFFHHGLLSLHFGADPFGSWAAAPEPPPAVLALALAAAVAVFTAWPLLAPPLAARRSALWGSALAGLLWLGPLMSLWIAAWGDGWIGLLPLGLGALTLAALVAALRTLEPAPRRRALVWLSAAVLALVALAIPLQLDRSWVVVGWGLQALGLVALWRRLDHPGLKWAALGLAALATARLVLGPLEDGYLQVVETPGLLSLAYAYLVPATALGLAARWLGRREIGRLRPWEERLVGHGLPWAAAGLGAATVLLGFVWITRTVLEGLGPGGVWGRSIEARNLTLSLAWILYAMGLLAVGFLRRMTPLRWTGLGVLVLTLAKVFLYDLGELEDLYRVASLVGLAVSLLLVSLAYQRFSRELEMEEGESEEDEEEKSSGKGGNGEGQGLGGGRGEEER